MSSKLFERETIHGQRYRRTEGQKPWPGLALIWILLMGEGLNQKLKSENIKIGTWETCWVTYLGFKFYE